MKDLFEILIRIIAEPNKTITEEDNRKAIRIFILLDDFLIDELPSYVQPECDNIDFGAFAAEKLDELEGLK